MVDERLIEAQFFADMARYNIRPRQDFYPVMDGKTHRFAVAQDKSTEKSGAYFIHSDGWPSWGVMDYHQHEGFQKGKFNARELDRSERAEIFKFMAMPDTVEAKRREAAKAEELKRQKGKEHEALIQAWHEYRASSNGLLSTHPYCQLKHINESRMLNYMAFIKECRVEGDKGMKGDLMIPYFAAESVQNPHAPGTWKFQTLQFIRRVKDKEGITQTQKRFYGDTHTKGACLPLIPWQKNIERILICEGAATGASLFKAFNYEEAVIIAGSCNNYLDVAKTFRQVAPTAKIIIAADHDKIGKDGKIRGLDAANAVIKAGYADEKKYPPIAGADWNDYFISRGVI